MLTVSTTSINTIAIMSTYTVKYMLVLFPLTELQPLLKYAATDLAYYFLMLFVLKQLQRVLKILTQEYKDEKNIK